ncbi:CopG family antitoxin [Nostoc sp.]|uniref:CopG family antitoxin n=3 Tax=unclassified Nostoc TaxID=2593658 RepID=UPI002FF9CCCF
MLDKIAALLPTKLSFGKFAFSSLLNLFMIYIVIMKEEYDFSQSVKNPYIKKLKKQVTIRLEEDVVDYFKVLAEETGISYQSLINLYLQDCVRLQRKPSLEWMSNV